MSDWFLNGEPCDEIEIDSRGLQYGDGLFETIAIRDEKPRLWSLHTDRLAQGCGRLGLDMPNTAALRQLIESQEKAFGIAKVIVAAKSGDRGYGRASRESDVMVRIHNSTPLERGIYEKGVAVMICDTTLATGSATAGLKTLNRLEQVLARNEVLSTECFEGLTRDADGRLICGTMSNLFAVKDDTIITPDLSRCGVEGVMRRHIIETLTADQRNIVITDIFSLEDVQEVFLSNSQFGVLPVRSCGDKDWPPGTVTRDLAQRLARNGVQEWSQ